MRLLVVLGLATGCLASKTPSGTQDPFCPSGWKFDAVDSKDGYCTPPTGYTALVWAELGGSGVYGYVRSGAGYLECELDRGSGDPPCQVRMIGATEIDIYNSTDVIDTTIRSGVVPLAMPVSSSQGVYKARLDPGEYRITGIDPLDGTRFWSPNLTVVPQALAECAIDVYPP